MAEKKDSGNEKVNGQVKKTTKKKETSKNKEKNGNENGDFQTTIKETLKKKRVTNKDILNVLTQAFQKIDARFDEIEEIKEALFVKENGKFKTDEEGNKISRFDDLFYVPVRKGKNGKMEKVSITEALFIKQEDGTYKNRIKSYFGGINQKLGILLERQAFLSLRNSIISCLGFHSIDVYPNLYEEGVQADYVLVLYEKNFLEKPRPVKLVFADVKTTLRPAHFKFNLDEETKEEFEKAKNNEGYYYAKMKVKQLFTGNNEFFKEIFRTFHKEFVEKSEMTWDKNDMNKNLKNFFKFMGDKIEYWIFFYLYHSYDKSNTLKNEAKKKGVRLYQMAADGRSFTIVK